MEEGGAKIINNIKLEINSFKEDKDLHRRKFGLLLHGLNFVIEVYIY